MTSELARLCKDCGDWRPVEHFRRSGHRAQNRWQISDRTEPRRPIAPESELEKRAAWGDR